MKYDDASWHYGAEDFPPGVPEEYGAVHIGVFLRLMFLQGYAGESHLEEIPEAVAQVLNGERTGTDFVMKELDGKLIDEDFNAEGNAFVRAYYSDGDGTFGPWLNDFATYSGTDSYVAPEEAVDIAAVERVFLDRLAGFRQAAGLGEGSR